MSKEQNGSIPESLAPGDEARDRSIIEALLTAADEPLVANRIADLLPEGVGTAQVATYVQMLNEEYMSTGRAFRITEVAGGYQFAVHAEFAPWIRNMMNEKGPTRLSQAALETLAIVAFKQPITKAEMEHIRGVNVDGVLRHLLEKGLVRISGRAEGVGRPLLYGTARDFLKFFGLNTLGDLPKLREIEELMKEEETVQGGLQALGGVRSKEATAEDAELDDVEDGSDTDADASAPGAPGEESEGLEAVNAEEDEGDGEEATAEAIDPDGDPDENTVTADAANADEPDAETEGSDGAQDGRGTT